MARRIATLLLSALLLCAARAQSVRWDPPRGTLAVGQASALALIFEDCSPKGPPVPPKVDGLALQFYQQSESTSVINLSVSHSVTYTYAALLSKKQRVEIPSFEVETDKGRLRVPAARFEPTGATVGNSGTPLESAATAKLTAKPESVWAGEVFELNATAEAARSYFPQFQRAFDWTAEPLLAEAWSNPEQIDFSTAGEPHTGIAFRTRAIARTPGSFKLNPATHLVNLSVGVSGFGFFQQRQYDQYSVTSSAPTIQVKPLPPAPAGFSGAVGQFTLASKVVPAVAAVGEPVTWTLQLSGTGNWPDLAGLPSRDVSKDFNVVQPQAKRTPAEGKLFEVTLSEDVVLVPTKPGNYTLGPINFVYFDPKDGTYKTITAASTKVTITPPDAPKFNLALPPDAADGTVAGAKAAAGPVLPFTPPPVPLLPSGLPRDPLAGGDRASLPLAPRTVAAWLIAAGAGLLAWWAALAVRRASQTDPALPRRHARARLFATLAKLKTAATAERTALLLDWQHDATALWEIAHAAPSAAAFNVGGVPPPRSSAEAGAATPPTSARSAWSVLWDECDRALYGTAAALPADWVARAEAALAGKRVPGFNPLRLFLPRNLAPFLFTLAVLALLPPPARGAVDASTAYRGGDFAYAEKIWRGNLATEPTDWAARYDLALALAQQDRWGESAAHAAAAFVQNPRDPAVRWHFALASEKAGFAPAPLAAFLQPGPEQSLAQLASPATWQRSLIGAAVLAALALGWLLFNAYGPRSRRAHRLGVGLWVLSLILAAGAWAGLRAYGLAADERAVIAWRAGTLRSIPTEADTAQKTIALAAGSAAVVDQTFLGWVRLSFANGQTGWVRKEETVPLWK